MKPNCMSMWFLQSSDLKFSGALFFATYIGRKHLQTCPCHFHVFEKMSISQRQSYMRKERGKKPHASGQDTSSCKLTGRWAPWLARGQGKVYLRQLGETSLLLVFEDVPGLSPEERTIIEINCTQSLNNLYFYLEVKISRWEAFPLSICGIGDPDDQLAKSHLLDQWGKLPRCPRRMA